MIIKEGVGPRKSLLDHVPLRQFMAAGIQGAFGSRDVRLAKESFSFGLNPPVTQSK